MQRTYTYTCTYTLCMRACVLACVLACVPAYAHWRGLLFALRVQHPIPPNQPHAPPCLLTLLAGMCCAPTCVIPCAASRVANVRRRLGLGWHGTQRAVTRNFPSPPLPSPEAVEQPHRSWRVSGSRTLLRAPRASRGASHSRQPKEHTVPSSHPGRLRRLPEEVARRRAERPSPRSRRLCRRQRRVRSRCRATRQSGPSSSSYCAATATN